MAFLTEQKLQNTLDIPIALPETELIQGDWIILATVKIGPSMRLNYQVLHLQLVSATVDIADIKQANKINSGLDLVFVGLYKDYNGTKPGSADALDIFQSNDLGLAVRSKPIITKSDQGNYSFVVANNMKAALVSAGGLIPTTTSIDFRIAVTGLVRLELESI